MADDVPLRPLHLGVALHATGWHPASWREPGARPRELLTAGYWADQVREAERGLLDLVTLEDSFGLESGHPLLVDDRTDQVRGQLDAVLVAARVAPLTRHIGIVPTAVVTHTEPFHLSKAIATLDYVSTGRAGVRVRVDGRPDDAALVGRRVVEPVDPRGADIGPLVELFDEAADWVEVVRRLWDSWEDDAEIRDVATGRFVDREKLHYIDFTGPRFSVRGPSITPRPPQGQPLVVALAHHAVAYRLAARQADLVFVTPHDESHLAALLGELRDERERAGRAAEPLPALGELLVYLDDDAGAAADRRARLDALTGDAPDSDAPTFAGTPAQLADQLLAWRDAGLAGARLRPAVTHHDLPAITGGLVPELQRRGAFRTAYQADTLRGLFGLPRPANRYATA